MARDSEISRRTVMKITGATAATALVAGCGGSDDDSGNGGDDGNGGDTDGNGGNGGDAIEPGEILFAAETSGWQGKEPEDIADEDNPTLTLQSGETYTIGWDENLDSAEHNIEIVDEDDEVVDELSTERTSDPGDDQLLEVEVSDEMAEYVCRPHQGSMRGTIEVVEGDE